MKWRKIYELYKVFAFHNPSPANIIGGCYGVKLFVILSSPRCDFRHKCCSMLRFLHI